MVNDLLKMMSMMERGNCKDPEGIDASKFIDDYKSKHATLHCLKESLLL